MTQTQRCREPTFTFTKIAPQLHVVWGSADPICVYIADLQVSYY